MIDIKRLGWAIVLCAAMAAFIAIGIGLIIGGCYWIDTFGIVSFMICFIPIAAIICIWRAYVWLEEDGVDND